MIPDYFDRWTPTATGQTRAVAGGAQGGNVSVVWAGVKVVNATPGIVYVRRHGGPLTDAGMADWEVPPFASSVFRLDGSSPGVTLRWEGQHNTDGGTVETALLADDAQVVTQTTGLAPIPSGRVERQQVFMGNIGGQTATVTPVGGWWVESVTITNPYTYAVEVYKTSAAGALVGVVPPFATQTFTLGAAAVYVRIVPFLNSSTFSRGPVGYYMDVILHGDVQPPSGPFPFHDFNAGPIGNATMFGASGIVGAPVLGVPQVAYTFPAPATTGAYYIVRQIRAELYGLSAPGPLPGINYVQARASLSAGWLGAGGAVIIGTMTVSFGTTGQQINRSLFVAEGPMHVYSDPAAANTLTITPTVLTNLGWLSEWSVVWSITGWRVLA